jgi:Pyruvate/2-oxoacid:ferredoxin oxidoreductase delta subunit
MMDANDCWQSTHVPKVFAIGDTIKPGLLTHAIAGGREVAGFIDEFLAGNPLEAKKKPVMIPQDNLSRELFMPRNRSRFRVTDAREEVHRCLSCGTCRDCSMCLETCPEGAIARLDKEDGSYEYVSDDKYCIGCGICAGICPCGVWAMEKAIP